jgi:hypothetical protein
MIRIQFLGNLRRTLLGLPRRVLRLHIRREQQLGAYIFGRGGYVGRVLDYTTQVTQDRVLLIFVVCDVVIEQATQIVDN